MENRVIEKAIELVLENEKNPISDDELDELECEDPAKADFYHDIANIRDDLINMGYDLDL